MWSRFFLHGHSPTLLVLFNQFPIQKWHYKHNDHSILCFLLQTLSSSFNNNIVERPVVDFCMNDSSKSTIVKLWQFWLARIVLSSAVETFWSDASATETKWRIIRYRTSLGSFQKWHSGWKGCCVFGLIWAMSKSVLTVRCTKFGKRWCLDGDHGFLQRIVEAKEPQSIKSTIEIIPGRNCKHFCWIGAWYFFMSFGSFLSKLHIISPSISNKGGWALRKRSTNSSIDMDTITKYSP